MSIEQELDDELKDALRSKDRARLDVIRQIRTEVAKAAAEPKAADEDSDARHTRIIRSYVKKMDKAREEYAGYGERGTDMVAKLAFETDYLGKWLPDEPSAADVEAIVADAISAAGVDDPKQAGRVIGSIMKEHQGLDGGLVNKLVREALGG